MHPDQNVLENGKIQGISLSGIFSNATASTASAMSSPSSPTIKVAEADGPSTQIRMHNGRFFPVSEDTGRIILHAGPDKQGFKTTPFGPGMGSGQ